MFNTQRSELKKLWGVEATWNQNKAVLKSIPKLEQDLKMMRSERDDFQIKLQLKSDKIDDLERMIDLMKNASKDMKQESVVKEIKSLLTENEKLRI